MDERVFIRFFGARFEAAHRGAWPRVAEGADEDEKQRCESKCVMVVSVETGLVVVCYDYRPWRCWR